MFLYLRLTHDYVHEWQTDPSKNHESHHGQLLHAKALSHVDGLHPNVFAQEYWYQKDHCNAQASF
jgi:hypothetical protein